jgi:YggT family protein
MVIILLIRGVDLLTTLMFLLVLTYVIISYFMSPYHPFRMWVNRIVEPMLAPIRKVVPLVGMLDFSPVILLVIIQIISFILKRILIIFL